MADKPTVVVSEPLDDRTLEYLGGRVHVNRIEKEVLGAHIGQADGLIVRTYTHVTRELLDKAPRLKVVGRAGVALDNIDVRECLHRGIQVVHTPAANTLAVVDYTIRMIIEMNRRFWPISKPMSTKEFLELRKQLFGRFLSGLTLGVVGAGRIGSRVGRAAAGLGMNVVYNDIKPIMLDYPARGLSKEELFAQSDIVTIHVPLTSLTRHFINKQTLAQFKKGAQFINAARGGCMVAADIAAALKSGQLSAATVDCHEPEPPSMDYPLYGLENVILTPHVAARVPQALAAMCDVVYDVVNVLEGRPPLYPAEEGSY